MADEHGFSLVEMLAALFVLSLGAVALSQSVGNMIKSWDRTKSDVQSIGELTDLVFLVEQAEARQRSDVTIPDGPTLEIDDGPALQLSAPRLDRDASCQFDMVGRSCR